VIRAAVVVETSFYREGLAAALAQADGLSVVGQARDRVGGVSLTRQARPDVVLLDVGLPRRAEAVAAMTSAAPAARIVALCVDDAATEVLPLAEAGVAGYVTRDQSLDELLDVVRSVARDEMPCSPGVAAALMRRLAARAAAEPGRGDDTGLTPREREVLELIRDGKSNQEIAGELVIEVSTVKNHVHNILEKLRVKDRAQAAACFAQRPLERTGT
jgi:two-component system, NarL family, nitrate/nitrite response regulator NarL